MASFLLFFNKDFFISFIMIIFAVNKKKIMKEVRLKFDIELPADILIIKDIFKANGFKLYVVGGAVRDAFLGITPKDFDLATDAIPDTVEKLMADAGFKTLPTGKAFGVINVFTESGDFEIATFRKDIGSGRRPEGVEFTTIQGDVERRDLTINALFFDIDTSEIVDLVGGLEDLKNGVIRTVGVAADRFGEDRLRILRAIRFAARFGSDLDPEIVEFLKKDFDGEGLKIKKFEGVSAERIRDEFIKGLKSAKSVNYFMTMLWNFNLLQEVFPNLTFLFSNFKKCEGESVKIILSILLNSNNSIDLKKNLNKLTYTNEEITSILFTHSLLRMDLFGVVDAKIKQKSSGLSDEEIRRFAIKMGMLPEIIDAFLRFELTVTGQSVMEEFGLKPGPEVGQKIHEIETRNFKRLLM